MPVVSKVVNVSTENVINPETVYVNRNGHVIFKNDGDFKVRVNLPNDVFSDHPDLIVDPQTLSESIAVSPQAPIGDNKYVVTWTPVGNSAGTLGYGVGDGAKSGNIRVEN